MIGPDSRHWENIHHCVIGSSLFQSVRQAGWLINVNLPYKREHPTLFRICKHSGSSVFLSCTVYGHDASFFHFNPFLCCSLEQKMSPGRNVSSSKTTQQNILIVFSPPRPVPCFWFLEKIVDNEPVRQWDWTLLCRMSFNCCRPGESQSALSAGQSDQRCRWV